MKENTSSLAISKNTELVAKCREKKSILRKFLNQNAKILTDNIFYCQNN